MVTPLATPTSPPVYPASELPLPAEPAPKKPRRKKPTPQLTDTSPEHLLDGMAELTPEGPLKPVKRTIEWPDSGYIEARAAERTQLYGGAENSAPESWLVPTTFDGMVQAVRARRKGQVKPAIPPSYQKTAKDVRPGQALIDDVIGVVASTLINGDRKFNVIPDDATQDEQDRATKVKRWVNAFILGGHGQPSRLEEECGEPFIDIAVEQACADGKAIWEVQLRDEMWSTAYGYPMECDYDDDPMPERDDYDEDEDGERAYQKAVSGRKTAKQKYLKAGDRFIKHAPAPIQVGRVDPLCYADWRLNGKAFEAIKIEMRSVREVYPLYGLWREGEHFDGTCYQRAGQDTHIVGDPYPTQQLPPAVGQMQARCVMFWKAAPELMNDKGEVPVIWVYEVDGCRVATGQTIGPPWHPLPFFPFNGMHTSLPDPAFKGVSIAFRLLRLCDAIDTLLSMKMNIAALFSMPAWQWLKPEGGQFDLNTGGAGAAAATGILATTSSVGGTFTVEGGLGYQMGAGEKIVPIVPAPESTAILNSLNDDLMEFINLVGLPAAIRGVSPGSGSPGYLVAQLIAAARTKLSPILNNASAALVSMIKFILWKCEHHFAEGVPVATADATSEWLTLLPADVDGRYACSLEIAPLLPVDKIQQEDHGMKMRDAGVISMRRLREEYVGLDNSREEQEQIEAEAIQKDELISLPRVLEAAVRLGKLTPEEARAIKAARFGIPFNSPAAAVGSGLLVGANGQPLLPQPPGAVAPTPGVPVVPDVPPIAPTPPDVNGPVGTAQVNGAAGSNMGPQLQPDRAAAAVGGP